MEEILKQFISSLSGAAIVAVLFGWVAKVKFEGYKIKLQKSEFLFQKEYEAIVGLSALIIDITPVYQPNIMDGKEGYYEYFAEKYDLTNKLLREYLRKYSPVLDEEVKALLVISNNDMEKYAVERHEDYDSSSISAEAIDAAKTILKNLAEAEKKLHDNLYEQIRN